MSEILTINDLLPTPRGSESPAVNWLGEFHKSVRSRGSQQRENSTKTIYWFVFRTKNAPFHTLLCVLTLGHLPQVGMPIDRSYSRRPRRQRSLGLGCRWPPCVSKRTEPGSAPDPTAHGTRARGVPGSKYTVYLPHVII